MIGELNKDLVQNAHRLLEDLRAASGGNQQMQANLAALTVFVEAAEETLLQLVDIRYEVKFECGRLVDKASR